MDWLEDVVEVDAVRTLIFAAVLGGILAAFLWATKDKKPRR